MLARLGQLFLSWSFGHVQWASILCARTIRLYRRIAPEALGCVVADAETTLVDPELYERYYSLNLKSNQDAGRVGPSILYACIFFIDSTGCECPVETASVRVSQGFMPPGMTTIMVEGGAVLRLSDRHDASYFARPFTALSCRFPLDLTIPAITTVYRSPL